MARILGWSNRHRVDDAAVLGRGVAVLDADVLADQLARPVRFADGVRALYDQGARVFLEVGAGQTLTGLAGRVLGFIAQGAGGRADAWFFPDAGLFSEPGRRLV